MIWRTALAAAGAQVRAGASCAASAVPTLVFMLMIPGLAAAGELEVRYYGAVWCAPCHQVEPMVDRWAADHPDLRIVKLDYDTRAADRERFDLVGVPMLVLLDGDKVIAKYGDSAQKVSDFAHDRLEWWYESARGKIDTLPQ